MSAGTSDLRRRARLRAAGGVLLLGLLTLFAFRPALDAGFLVQDDDLYVTRNALVQRGLTVEGALWAWTSFHTGNWHPLTWLSLMLDADLHGMRAGGYHATNLLLHAGAASLLFLALAGMTGRAGDSFLVAVLFAVHPLRAESVVWVAERKDVLCALFWAAALLLHLRHARRPSPARFAAVAACTAAALLAKPMAVSLPPVLLLLDWWPLGRWRSGGIPLRRCVAEKVPLLALAAAAATLTYVAQHRWGATEALGPLPLGFRLANALLSVARYVGLMLWPPAMRPVYPHPGTAVSLSGAALAGAGLAIVTAGLFLARRRCPAALLGWAWYLLALLPVIGIVQVGRMAMADRYTYLPSAGLALAAVWGGAALLARRPALRTGVGIALALAAGAVLAPLARANARRRSDTISVIAYALEDDANRWVTLKQLGGHLYQRGDWERAAEFYRLSLEARPDQPDALFDLGLARRRLGDHRGALAALRRFVELEPASARGRYHLAGVLRDLGDLAGARAEIAAALRLNPGEEEFARFERQLREGVAAR